jgi:hypothetical protein
MFIAAVLVEETLKYLPIAYARRRCGGIEKESKTQHRNRAHRLCALRGVEFWSPRKHWLHLRHQR